MLLCLYLERGFNLSFINLSYTCLFIFYNKSNHTPYLFNKEEIINSIYLLTRFKVQF